MRLVGWEYHDGAPYYMETINQWSERMRPCWRCSAWTYDDKPLQQIADWLTENSGGTDWETIYRFNSGNPFLQVMIYDDQLAMAFRLRWDEHFAERR